MTAVKEMGLRDIFILFYRDVSDNLIRLIFPDMIAIPDYPLGAMENWGLITYRETAMLFDPAVSTEYNRQRVTIVIAHEVSHQVREG